MGSKKYKEYGHKETEFQKTFKNDKEGILAVVELLYPDFNVDWNIERGKLLAIPHPFYTWLEIQYKKGNMINFAINNHAAFYNGQSIYGRLSPDIYPKLNFKFEVIAFNSGSLSKEVTEKCKKRVDQYLRRRGYTKPSLHEWWREYNAE